MNNFSSQKSVRKSLFLFLLQTDDVELEARFGLFECSVEALTIVCTKSSKVEDPDSFLFSPFPDSFDNFFISLYIQISSCQVPDVVQLPLVLRDPLLHDMDIYLLSVTPEDNEKRPLSDIFMGCALLCHFMHGYYITRLVNSSYSWFFLKLVND